MSFIGSLFSFPTSVMSFMCGRWRRAGTYVLGPMGLLPCSQNTVNYFYLPVCRIQKEYKANGSLRRLSRNSYEALPSNYGLGRNMLAGAFAGIAV